MNAGRISAQEISDILRKNFPELAERTPIGKPGTDSLPRGAYDADSTPAKEVLRVQFGSAESTFVDLAEQLLEIEKREKEGMI